MSAPRKPKYEYLIVSGKKGRPEYDVAETRGEAESLVCAAKRAGDKYTLILKIDYSQATGVGASIVDNFCATNRLPRKYRK